MKIKFLKNKLIYWTIVFIMTGCLWDMNKKSSQPKSSDVSYAVRVFREPKKKSRAYEPIKEILIRDFTRDFLERVTPSSFYFQGLEKKYGKESLLEKYVWTHELNLNLAENKRRPSEEDYKNLAQLVAESQNVISAGVGSIDYCDERIVNAFVPLVKLETTHYISLINTDEKLNLPTPKTKEEKKNYIRRLIRETYKTRKEYSEYIEEMNKNVGNLYEVIGKTLKTIEKPFGLNELRVIKKITQECYSKTIDDFFPK